MEGAAWDIVAFLSLIRKNRKMRDQQRHMANHTMSTLKASHYNQRTCLVLVHYKLLYSVLVCGAACRLCFNKVLTFKIQWKHGGAHEMEKTCVLCIYSCFVLGFHENNRPLFQDTWSEERVNNSVRLHYIKTVDRNRVMLNRHASLANVSLWLWKGEILHSCVELQLSKWFWEYEL